MTPPIAAIERLRRQYANDAYIPFVVVCDAILHLAERIEPEPCCPVLSVNEIRNAALEEAAKIADAEHDAMLSARSGAICRGIANKIRALKSE